MTIAELLLLYARQFEDQHAPEHITLALRAAAAEIERLRAGNQQAALDYLGRVGQLSDEITRLRECRSEQVLELKHHIDQQYAEIVRFQSQIKRLKTALRMLYDEMDEYQRINNLSAYNNQVMRQARAALEGK